MTYSSITRRTRPKAKRQRPRRVRPELFHGHKRVVLHGEARMQRRAEIFARAGGRCEEFYRGGIDESPIPGLPPLPTYYRCGNRATEWSHARHGSNKCDCLNPRCSIASCAECHRKRHGGGKPVPKKEGAA